MLRNLMPAVRVTLVLTILTGMIYPGIVTILSKLMFPKSANGSLIEANGKVVGSELIGQTFSRPEYFHGRPSAAGDGYDAANSSGSNLGPTNEKLATRVKADVALFRKANPYFADAIPSDLLTTSGSGLDPHISPASAYAQVPRVARARGVSDDTVRRLVAEAIEDRQLGFLGEPRVNVLRLNLALDRLNNSVP
ncbi:MAG TPA: potassium-transporting ATPase subunit KdpC [Acidobacteriota bacterium]|nr:potassium-transporting ATPase subunit KdpC [Acidobacteriota bacterium]